MGTQASRGQAFSGLGEPLLAAQCQRRCAVADPSRSFGGTSSCHAPYSGSQPSAPASFKANKHRKTKDFISSEMSLDSRIRSASESSDVDPRLLGEADTTHAISAKVASLICQYVEEAGTAAKGPSEDALHEANFVRRRCCCPRRSTSGCLSVDTVFDLINDIADSLYFCKQVIVLCAIYIDRLLDQTQTKLTTGNWRSVVVVALLVASKVWEDVHPWNADFEECLQEVAGIRYYQGALYRLEAIFLEKLEWRVFVDGEIYAAYFFSLLEGRPQKQAHTTTRASRHYSDFAIQTIIEEDHAGSDSDIERGVLGGEETPRWSPRRRSLTPRKCAPGCSPLPWSRDQLVCRMRQRTLDSVSNDGEQSLDSSSLTLRAIHECWRLDAGNPHIGSLRHAPRALAPSRHIPQSEGLLWEHELAAKTTQLLGHRRSSDEDAALTLSGATGTQLASELRQYLKKRGEEAESSNVRKLSSLQEESLWSRNSSAV
eukprot:TRINITY_DN106796_c0_g1_i1.p1 TRINITY_DN106796_c0_g1~~TRINITY_DN106796_c0_g1_i1.p1  ORF type:complete len:509 (-),score=74.71 TRINITY_DN106796_c0_g1_i1:69-1526(-)